MASAPPPPISLFLDESPISIVGGQALLHWWIRNNGTQELFQLKLELQNMEAQAFSQHEDGFTLALGGEKQRISSILKIRESGHYQLPVHITARDIDGNPLEFTSVITPIFSYDVRPQEGDTSINVKGNALFTRVRNSGRLHIEVGGDAIFKDVDFGMGRQTQQNLHGLTAPDESLLKEIKLRVLEPPGIRPVNFEKLLSYWPYPKHLSINFIGERKQTIKHAKVDDLYQLKIRTFQRGYLTLISRGSSGRFYMMAPNKLGLGGDWLDDGQHFFPGKLLLPLEKLDEDEQEIFFADAGTEYMLALLSKAPLISALDPFSNIPEVRLAELLTHARGLPDTDIGLARVEVTD